jgi:hypothetical protein
MQQAKAIAPKADRAKADTYKGERKGNQRSMPRFVYVYILRSLTTSDTHYAGLTSDLRTRLREHNSGIK